MMIFFSTSASTLTGGRFPGNRIPGQYGISGSFKEGKETVAECTPVLQDIGDDWGRPPAAFKGIGAYEGLQGGMSGDFRGEERHRGRCEHCRCGTLSRHLQRCRERSGSIYLMSSSRTFCPHASPTSFKTTGQTCV